MAIKLVNNDSTDYTNPDSAGVAGLDERLDLIDDKGNTVASFVSDADGARTLTVGGVKRYRALLTQSGTNAPVATVIENTLGGEVVWSRHAEGAYNATLADVFTANKTLLPGRTVMVDSTDTVAMAGERVSASVLRFTIVRWHWEDLTTQSMSVYELSDAAAAYPNHIWDVEILVYP